jgi:hypothetical protein
MENKNTMKETYYSEKYLERLLNQRVKELGGFSIKQTSIKGLPDRLVVLPNNRGIFVELKSTGQKPKKLQKYWLSKFETLGWEVALVDSKEKLEALLF